MKKILLVPIITLILSAAFSQKGDKPNGPHIEFRSEVFDYGTIIVDSDHDGIAEFYFLNTGNEPLVLSNVRAGCGCTSPFWHKEPVMPGDSAKVVLKYTTIRHPHAINRSAVVSSNAINKPSVVLRITGTVVAKPEEVMPEKHISNEFSPVAK